MNTRIVPFAAALVAYLCWGAFAPHRHAYERSATSSSPGPSALQRLPVPFVPNVGQWDDRVRFAARFGVMTTFLEEAGWTVSIRPSRSRSASESELPGGRATREPSSGSSAPSVALRMTFLDCLSAEMRPGPRLPGHHNYYLGSDASRWRDNVPLHESVCYSHLYPGIDVCVRDNHGVFEYDLVLDPTGQLDHVAMQVDGIDGMSIGATGELVMETPVGPVHMPVPLTWEQDAAGERHAVPCRYVLHAGNRFGFAVPERQPGWHLTVDPGLVFSTFFGGVDTDDVHCVALDAQSAPTFGGETRSANLPTTLGAHDPVMNGSRDAFLTQLTPSGNALVFSTFFGGTGEERFDSLAFDSQGRIVVVGSTTSNDMPTTPGAFDGTFNGGNADAFVTQFNASGSGLLYSSYLGGSGSDEARAAAAHPQGGFYVAGTTDSAFTFPTTPGALDTTHGGQDDGFVIHFSASAALLQSTFLGSSFREYLGAMVIDSLGRVIVGGQTLSPSFPTTIGAFDRTHNGNGDGFIACLDSALSSLVYSTFLGGWSTDGIEALALDASGRVTAAGVTWSADFPTTPGAFDTSFNGGNGDGFVAQLSPTAGTLTFSTFLGGTEGDGIYGLAIDPQGAATVAGATFSATFPTTVGAYQTPSLSQQGRDAFVTRLAPAGDSLVYSTLLGESGGFLANDMALRVALDGRGWATVVGWTSSTGFPVTPGSWDQTYNGGSGFGDSFVTRLDMLPSGVSAFGASSPGCAGPLPISVTSMPRVGNVGFAITCSNAAANATGVMGYSAGALASPIPLLGVDLWIDPTLLLASLSVTSSANGDHVASLPIPNNAALVGTRLFAQYVWLGPSAPSPCPPLGVSASNALDFTIQP